MERSLAIRGRDDAEFARFQCWDGNAATPWVELAEEYARVWALRISDHVLAFRDDDGELIAVSAFSRGAIDIPFIGGAEHPAWYIEVVAIAVDHQRQGLSQDVFVGTFEIMQELDPTRILVTGKVHKDHSASRKACAAVGMHGLFEENDGYWIVLGDANWRP
jgi:RimJ/RimL family protein N-acetyltransferase